MVCVTMNVGEPPSGHKGLSAELSQDFQPCQRSWHVGMYNVMSPS